MAENRSYLFTSESVTEGHPDKVADQISDAILDAILKDDPMGRVACETMVTTGLVVVAGEITTNTYVDMPKIVRKTIEEIGYTRAKYGFDFETCGVITSIDEQSADISQGVSHAIEERLGGTEDEIDQQGAGDQGMMFGFACDETPELMPMPIMMAHKLSMRLAQVRKDSDLTYLRPDGKSQVTVLYENGKPKAITKIVLAAQHREDVDVEATIRPDLIEHVVKPVVPAELMSSDCEVLVNPTGKFAIGGPMGDCGLTGRKIIVDTYGGMARHGGGAFSGKDPTKVDRSGAYMGRYVAKNIVAAGLASKCELEVAYAIGRSHPVSVMVDCFGTEKMEITKLEEIVKEVFDFRPAAILRDLDLRRPLYRRSAAYGHFGRENEGFPWEVTDKVDELKSLAGI